jgi:mRNA-degrading endonuclease RelE of RelBE toxin-antitoxin system
MVPRRMQFVETRTFTRLILNLMSDDEYLKLQRSLAERPELGKVISGSGGLRKLRWRYEGRGKRGGLRVIYYWATADETIWMLLIYVKNQKEDLSREQIRELKILVKEVLP